MCCQTVEQQFSPALAIASAVALMVGTNHTYLSHVINDELDTNFRDLIKGYQLKYAKSLLEDSESTIGMEELSIASSFKGKSSFYRVFKEKEGITPGQYRLRLLNQKNIKEEGKIHLHFFFSGKKNVDPKLGRGLELKV